MGRSRWLLLLLASGCFARFDLDQPIALVPGASLSESQVNQLTSAAACWANAFNVPFVVDRDSVEPQQVSIELNPFACNGRLGQYVPGQPGAIDLCPYSYSYRNEPVREEDFFKIVLHELGHASGIARHARTKASVMGEATGIELGSAVFSAEDIALFDDANDRSLVCEVQLFGRNSFAKAPNCLCPPPCEPDPLEPSDLTERVPLAGDADLNLCIDDVDAFSISEARTVQIESDDPRLAVRTGPNGGPSMGAPSTTPGNFMLDLSADSYLVVASTGTDRETVTHYQIRFLPR